MRSRRRRRLHRSRTSTLQSNASPCWTGSDMNKNKTERFASVWDALADTAQEAANLKVRAELMRKIASLIQENGWTQAAAAERCGITQPRINDLLRGRISRFSLDALVNIAASLGRKVHVELDAA
nr:helix-turn-helix transcriptional regulator [uncultured Xanthomonas sp.]